VNDDAKDALRLEQRIKAEAERCAQAIKLLGCGELKFMPDGMDGAALLACFLLELEAQCAKIGTAARIVFLFHPLPAGQAAQAEADDSLPAAGDAVH
jgi:hypothetical protein